MKDRTDYFKQYHQDHRKDRAEYMRAYRKKQAEKMKALQKENELLKNLLERKATINEH